MLTGSIDSADSAEPAAGAVADLPEPDGLTESAEPTDSPGPADSPQPPPGGIRLVVDLNRCQSYGQCVYAAPAVFRFHGEEALEYDYAPAAGTRREVERAAAACPVQAISLGRATEPAPLVTEPASLVPERVR
jgi:ferredoxin